MFDSGTVSAVVAVVGLALTCVALFASWRVSQRGVSTQVYREAAAAWETKSKAQDAEIGELRAVLAERDQAMSDLKGRVSVLQDTVTGAQSWAVLERRTAEMLALAAESRTETRQVYDAVRESLRELRGMSDDCGRVLARLGGEEGTR
jgi:uncharacterized coiled-coil protein SlyX